MRYYKGGGKPDIPPSPSPTPTPLIGPEVEAAAGAVRRRKRGRQSTILSNELNDLLGTSRGIS